jgi:transglutaminase-like putative cysteine protease
MLKKLIVFLIGLVVAAILVVYLLSLPLIRRLPRQKSVALEGVTTIDEAVMACRRSNLQGWELVAYAQNLVARKFTYSRLNSWESPSRAFERGRGYCQQSALALHKIYRALGIDSRPVHALRCKFPAKVVDGFPQPELISGHVWLRVRVGAEERFVCPGAVDNRPGQLHFEILSRIYNFRLPMQVISYFGSALVNLRRDAVARKRSTKQVEETKEYAHA